MSANTRVVYYLSGMGRPVSDDEGGFGNTVKPNTTPDFLSLEEFLAESADKSSPKQKVPSTMAFASCLELKRYQLKVIILIFKCNLSNLI